MTAALENDYGWIWLALLFASAGVFHHAGIKIPYFAFFAHDSGIRTSDPPTNMLIAMSIAAVLCIAIGVYPSALYSLFPYDTGYNPYDATHVLAQTQLLFFSALAFVWLNLRGLYPPELPSTHLDIDWFYRRVFPTAARGVFSVIWSVDSRIRQAIWLKLDSFLGHLALRGEGPSNLLSRTRPLGSMVMWVAVLLASYLLLSFIG